MGTTPASAPLTLPRADFSATVEEFLRLPVDAVLGRLLAHAETYATEVDQANAWLDEIPLLQRALAGIGGTLMLEFHIPRFGRRADAVLLSGPVVFVLEFKTTLEPGRAGLDQVWDYTLDLKYFHAASHAAPIVPVLVAPGAGANFDLRAGGNDVYEPFAVAPETLTAVLAAALAAHPGPAIDAAAWAAAPYRPTPTILEAARALYARHTVDDIARFDAGADNLGRTTRRLEDLLEEAQRKRRKLLCLVTGVPGAGKTLAGLNLATRHARNDETHAVFLSGNDPLVAVLSEALVRDELGRRRAAGEKVRKKDVTQPVESFLQNVRHFRDEGLRDPGPPHEHIAIFDEAQRAWTAPNLDRFIGRRRKPFLRLWQERCFPAWPGIPTGRR
jgi:Schlafen group 3, DNA/RNA helicase domain